MPVQTIYCPVSYLVTVKWLNIVDNCFELDQVPGTAIVKARATSVESETKNCDRENPEERSGEQLHCEKELCWSPQVDEVVRCGVSVKGESVYPYVNV